MTTVGIVGYGHVGRAMAQLFPEAIAYDPYIDTLTGNRDAVNRADITFICVPTPSGPDGAADTTAIEEVLGWLDSEIIVIKSTVPPGTTSELRKHFGKRIVVSPEYFGESRFVHPWSNGPHNWPFVVVGGDGEDTRAVVSLFASVMGPHVTYRQVRAEEAELAKYMENTWLAAQVVFAWQFGLIAESCDIDYWEVREIWSLDPRVSKWHTALFDDSPGFEGKCLPKDVAAIARAGRSAGADVSLLESIMRFNDALRARVAPHMDLQPAVGE